MKRLLIPILAMLAFAVASAQPAHQWMHMHHNGTDFHSFKLSDIEEISHAVSGAEPGYVMVTTRDGKVHTISMEDLRTMEFGYNVPSIYITLTDCPEMTELEEKDLYLNATVSIDGNGIFEDITDVPLKIKGRGNSTWRFPKKPYRFKFDSKISLFGMKKAKNYALIANYIDCSHMRNAFALEMAARLGMQFTNSVQPVRVYLNGILKGAYFITEKIGIGSASVDIDETTGILFEIDANFDEPYQFHSDRYNLPVMVKDPDFDELEAVDGVAPADRLAMWQADFNAFEQAVYDGTWTDLVDMESFVDYLLVYDLCGNHELIHPKSMYLYKGTIDDKYHFGPVWDFDWAFTYINQMESADATEMVLDPDPGQNGGYFLIQMCKHPDFMPMFKARWQYFRTTILPGLMEYLDDYADIIAPSAIEDGVLWPTEVKKNAESSFEFRSHQAALKAWIQARADFIDSHVNMGLYDPEIPIPSFE